MPAGALPGSRYVRKTVGVITPAGTLGIVGQIWREGIRKQKKS
jgi:hypothetical protein